MNVWYDTVMGKVPFLWRLTLDNYDRRQTGDRHSRLTAILVKSHSGLTGMNDKSM